MSSIATTLAFQYEYKVCETKEKVVEGKKVDVTEEKTVIETFIPSIQAIVNSNREVFFAVKAQNMRNGVTLPLNSIRYPMQHARQIDLIINSKFPTLKKTK